MQRILPKTSICVTQILLWGNIISVCAGADHMAERTVSDMVPRVIAVTHRPIRINQSAIIRHKKKIEHNVYYAKMVRYAIRSAAAGAAVYCFCSMAKNVFSPSLSEKNLPGAEKKSLDDVGKKLANVAKIPDSDQSTQKVHEKTNELVELFHTLSAQYAKQELKNTGKIAAFFSGVVSRLQSFGMFAVTVVGPITLQSYLEMLLQPEDITWFIQRNTHLEDSFEQIKVNATAFDSRDAIADQKEVQARIALQENMRDLIYQLEHIIGFMEFLLERETKYGRMVPDDLQSTPQFLIYVVNEFCAQLEAKLATVTSETRLAHDVTKFIEDVTHILGTYKNFSERIDRAQENIVHE